MQNMLFSATNNMDKGYTNIPLTTQMKMSKRSYHDDPFKHKSRLSHRLTQLSAQLAVFILQTAILIQDVDTFSAGSGPTNQTHLDELS